MNKLVIELTSTCQLNPYHRDPASWLPDPEALLALPAAPQDEPLWRALGQHVCAPWQHLATTHHTARAAALGAATGRAFYHHELRARLPYPEALGPEVAVWDADQLTPAWGDGVLVEPKYFSFFQDAPLPAYNPNHRIKWRAHELLHGACAFYWSPALTRFGCYLGTRLNELVPVVHWYGLDEIGRPACPAHTGVTLGRALCPACEAAQRPFWTHDAPTPAQRAASLAAAAHAVSHAREELDACQRELETLRPHPTPRAGLDASSDAIGYMQSHWARLTSWSFGAWMERFCVVGVDYDDTLDAYMDRVGGALHALIGADITLDLDVARRLRARRAVQDVAARALVAQEWLEGRRARAVEAALEPALAACEAAASGLLEGSVEPSAAEQAIADLIAACVQHQGAFPADVGAALPAVGHSFGGLDPVAPALDQLIAGARSAAPIWCDRAGDTLPGLLTELARAEIFQAAAPLGERLSAWLLERGDADGAATVGLESWLRAAPRSDEDAERFGVVPEDAEALTARPARVALHATLRRATWPRHIVTAVLGDEMPAGPLAARISGGEVEVMAEDAQTAAVLELIARGQWREADPAALIDLIAQGWVVWIA